MRSVTTPPEIHLLPLACPSCGAGIEADGEDVVFYCIACRNGYRFDSTERTLQALEVTFVSTPHRVAEVFKPFWLVPAQIRIHERRAKAGGFSGLLGFFFGAGGEPASVREGTFAVPAFHTSLSALTQLARRYTESLPDFGERLGERLLGGRYGIEDAQKLAQYVVVATEVDRPDTLTGLRYSLEFGTPRLLGVPFVRGEKGWQDAVFEIGIGASEFE